MTNRSYESNRHYTLEDAAFDNYDYLGNSASATDCTGLIPANPVSEAELESYEAIYHYQPKTVLKSQEKEKEN